MNHFVRFFKECKFRLALSFALFCALIPNFIGIATIMNKFITSVHTYSKELPDLFAETAGLCA